MRRRRLYRYFSDLRWAKTFINGDLLFHSLAYFRDFEDEEIRGDQNEGTAVYRPSGGLIINNLTKGTQFTLPGYAFESSARAAEIFVFCLSRSLNDELRREFQAVAYVEILDIPRFCAKIQNALPADAKFPTPRRGRPRIGWPVEYYQESETGNPRWALPDKIALSKSVRYKRQDEFRLVFSLTDAFEFENVSNRLKREVTRMIDKAPHKDYMVSAGSLDDICTFHKFT